MDAAFFHLGSVTPEIVGNLFLDHERFHRLCPGDTLVKVSGDTGIDLTDLAVHFDEFLLENAEKNHDQRNDQNDQQRKLRIDDQHDGQRADQVGDMPDTVNKRP